MMMKLIKKITPKYIKNIYRLHGEYFFYRKRISELEGLKNYALLIGTPVHENIGDHLITYSEILFLNNSLRKKIVEIPIEAYKLFKKNIADTVDSSVPIFIQGGGWMGSVWPEDELLIRDIIRTFRNNQIIVFPQSSYYERVNGFVKDGQKVYRGNKLSVFLRDNRSYNSMKELFPELNVFLEPDMALYLKGRIHINRLCDNNVIAVCFRDDREETQSELKEKIISYLENNNINYKSISTIASKSIKEHDRDAAVNQLLTDFSQFNLIITDRLHGMIAAYIAGVPCIAIDNKTHKVVSVYNTWLKNSNLVMYVQSMSDFIQCFNRKNVIYDDNIFQFETLLEVINSGRD